MPEYEYRCRNCQQIFSIERSMNDSSTSNCSHCGSADTARIWGANLVTASAKGQRSTASAGAASGMCESNPSQPKSCCPCSGS